MTTVVYIGDDDKEARRTFDYYYQAQEFMDRLTLGRFIKFE